MKKRRMKILITGSSGYIGSAFIKRYWKRFSFVTYDIRQHKRQNVLDIKNLEKVVRGVDGVLHLAAVSRPKWGYEDPYGCLVTNILGTINVLEAVRKVNPRAWIILGSSREVFGDLNKLPGDEKSPRRPLNAYGVSKACGEDLLRQYARNYGMRCFTLRFCGVYTGRGDIFERVVPKFILSALRSAPLVVEGNGKKKFFDFVHTDDTVAGVEKAVRFISRQKKGFYDDITLAANHPVSIYDLARLVIQLVGGKSKIVFSKNRTYDQKGYWGKYDKAKKLLGWRPKISMKNGLKMAIAELKPIVGRGRFSR